MLPLPETLSVVELLWIVSTAAATIGSAIALGWARDDLRFVRREYVEAQGRGGHVERSFKRDVSVVAGRLLISLALLAAGILAAFDPNRPRALAGWIIVCLLFTVPLYLVWRNVVEATDRRHTLKDVARAYRNGGTS